MQVNKISSNQTIGKVQVIQKSSLKGPYRAQQTHFILLPLVNKCTKLSYIPQVKSDDNDQTPFSTKKNSDNSRFQ